MFKRPDSDIFGTKQLNQGVKIKNDSFVDPNEAFKKKNDENYGKYINKLGNVGRKNIDGNPEMTKVNQKVTFDDEYHKDRKFRDLQSSIFCEEKIVRPKTTHQDSNPLKQKNITNNDLYDQYNHGRKNTLRREIDSLPYNQSNIKGNASQLFDFDVRNQVTSESKNQTTLIPHQMQWDQHDSIRYNHHKQSNKLSNNQSNIFEKSDQVKSVQEQGQMKNRKETLNQIQKSLQKERQYISIKQTTDNINKQKNQSFKKQQKKVNNTTSGDIQIKIIRGWDNKFMEGLSKYCKLYSTPMTRFQLQGAGKAIIYLRRTKKWQAITDWLVKDAKLKVRIVGN